MAVSIQSRKRASGTRYTATVRRGSTTVSASFWQKKLAAGWGRQCEIAIDTAAAGGRAWDRAEWIRRGRDATGAEARSELREIDFARAPDTDDRPRTDWTLARALRHYHETVTPSKKGTRQEGLRLAAWQAHALAAIRLDRVTAAEVQTHVDERTGAGRAAMTVRNETLILSAVYRHAAAAPRPGGGAGGGWGLAGLVNPVTAVHLPAPPQGRQRRLQDGEGESEAGEEARIRAVLSASADGTVIDAVMTLAVETGLRLSEMLGLRRSQMRRARGTRWIEQPDSKNGSPRRVVLSSRAAAAADALAREADGRGIDARLIPLSEDALRWRWRRACAAAGVQGLTLHDLRHEALSRQAAAGLTIGELQQQSGHRTAQVLLRYVNARAADVSRKLG